MKKRFLTLCLLLPLFLVTGCPSNQYVIDLTPRGLVMERRILFYCEDGKNTNGEPNYQGFSAADLAQILSHYPANSVTQDKLRYTVVGEFAEKMPSDVGGAGSYTNVATSMGSAGFYLERFRGDDDLATGTAKRLKAADRVTDLVIGWSRMELGHERGYENLRRFLDTDFRRDVKNLSMYAWMLQTSSATRANPPEEFAVRFGQYLAERGYISVNELPELFRVSANQDPRPMMRMIRRLVAAKLSVHGHAPATQSLAFLSDWDSMAQSWEKYLMTTDLYRTKLRHWQKEKIVHEIGIAGRRVQGFYDPRSRTNAVPAAPGKPSPSEVLDEMAEGFLAINIFNTDDHVTVRLSLPAAPTHTNGKWDETRKQVIWESDIEQPADNNGRVPAFCYANWSEPDEAAQRQHFGKVILSGDALSQYCLWRGGLKGKSAQEWDAVVAGLQPGAESKQKIETFRFSSEPIQRATNGQTQIKVPSDFARELILPALEKTSVVAR